MSTKFRQLIIAISFLFLFGGKSIHSQYTLNSLYGNLVDCDTMARGIFVIWWDNNWNHSTEADILLDTLIAYRNACLNELSMIDPPNPIDGYFYNIYLHQSGSVFPSGWGNGQGTDGNGYPFLTLPAGLANNWINNAHEAFHIFQYNANSPGFSYSGDSQWYIEASANWFSAIRNYGSASAFLEAESLVRLPHVPLWLSYDNFPSGYPSNWQRYVHQYAMALLLYYLTEEENVNDSLITYGLFSGTNELPQEFFYNQLGGTNFRNYFINWAAHMVNHFDFVTPAQITVFENEWNTYADPIDDHEFIQTYDNTGTGGWYRPDDTVATTGWSFNTYQLNNNQTEQYTFQINGDATGSYGSNSYFQGKLVVLNSISGASFYDLNMLNDLSGNLTLNLMPSDTTVYFIIASMPQVFTNVDQVYSYQMRIDKGVTGIENWYSSNPKYIVERYNISGQVVDKNYQGLQFWLYNDGTIKKVLNQMP